MDIKKYIGFCLVEAEISEAELARRMEQSPQNLHNKLSRDTLKLSELEKIADALGCDIEIKFVSRDTGKPIV